MQLTFQKRFCSTILKEVWCLLSLIFLSYDVFVSTAQMLLNAINDPEQNVCLESFCLFIFDECHHCGRKHPFQRIVDKYVDTRLDRNGDKSRLPQVKHYSLLRSRQAQMQALPVHLSKENSKARVKKMFLLFRVPSRTITTSRVFPIECLPESLGNLRVPSRINNSDYSTHSKRKLKEVQY